MKKKLIKGFIIYCSVFFAFFVFRLIYGAFEYPSQNSYFQINNLAEQRQVLSFGKTNIASYNKMVKKGDSGPVQISGVVEQKYERVANLSSYSKKFKDDEIKIRNSIKKYDALIQYEQNSGLEGNQKLDISIGVDPSKFDEMVLELVKIGKIQSKYITKIDKTNEYKDLNANKKSLLRIRNSLMQLKRRSGKIDEFINLENKILEIDEKIQSLGIKLGEFDSENEFCTIKFSLGEAKEVINRISVLHRIKTALEWTIKYYLLLTFILILGLGFVLVVLLIINQFLTIYYKVDPKSGEKKKL